MLKTQWLEERFSLAVEPVEDVLKFLEHGVKLATESPEISASLRMLHMIECYKTVVEANKLTPMIKPLVGTLTRNVQPQSQVMEFVAKRSSIGVCFVIILCSRAKVKLWGANSSSCVQSHQYTYVPLF